MTDKTPLLPSPSSNSSPSAPPPSYDDAAAAQQQVAVRPSGYVSPVTQQQQVYIQSMPSPVMAPSVILSPQSHVKPSFSIWSAFSAFSPSGQLGVYTDKPYYVSGELITGRVMANITQPVTCRAVLLQVTGLEKVEWHERRTENVNRGGEGANARVDTIHYLKRHRGHRHFFQVRIKLYDLQGNAALMPGQYTFPFTYQLPEGLPGSFYERRELGRLERGTIYEDDNHYGDEFNDSDDEEGERRVPGAPWAYRRPELLAIVNYKLKAVLDVNGFFSPNLFSKLPLIVHPRLSGELRPAFGEQAHDIVICCCCNYGNCALKVKFDKNAYCPGETARIEADINNDSSKDLPTTVKLWRTLTLKSGKWGGQHHERKIAMEQRYENVPPKNHVQRPMPLMLPMDLKPTTVGQYVTCTYEYAVEANVSWGSDVRVSMNVLLYAPQPPELTLKPLF